MRAFICSGLHTFTISSLTKLLDHVTASQVLSAPDYGGTTVPSGESIRHTPFALKGVLARTKPQPTGT